MQTYKSKNKKLSFNKTVGKQKKVSNNFIKIIPKRNVLNVKVMLNWDKNKQNYKIEKHEFMPRENEVLKIY